MKKRVLITDYVHQDLPTRLGDMGYDIDYQPTLLYSELGSIIHQYTGIIINSKIRMNVEMIDLATQLEFIGRLGSGLDIIDLNYAAQKNIHVISTPEGNRRAVAEHAIGMLLALNNNLLKADREVRNFIWKREENRGTELQNKVIGLVGLGNTGQTMARLLSSWAQRIVYYDKYLLEHPPHLSNIESVNLNELKKRADIISFHIPLTSETLHLVDTPFLNDCKDGVTIINTSRGKVMKTEALLEALDNGKIGGLCMDVFENEKTDTYTESEKLRYQALFNYPNTVFSPHIAGWTNESLQKIANTMVDKIAQALEK